MDDKIKEKKLINDNLVNHKKEREQQESKKNKSSEVIDPIEVDDVIAPPKPTPDMFYGLVGEVASIASTGTETNPASAALVFLSFLGANVGRDTFLLINNTYHHARLFTLHIGRTSQGGKGDSQQLTRRIMSKIEQLEPELLGKLHTGGLSSGEGLAAMIHDGYGETPPIHDKRLFVIEGELANVLNKMRREGNVLSSTLREMWDGSDIKPAVKTRPMGVTEPHIGIHACVTPTELTNKMCKGEMDNGFANRFLMVFAENIGCIPFPEETPGHIIDELAYSTIEVIKFALGNYPDASNSEKMHLTQAAKVFYGQIYRNFKTQLDNEVISGLLARRAPYTMRLAMLFALTEKQTEIIKNANKILEFLEDSAKSVSRTEITRNCFKGNTEAKKIGAAVKYLLLLSPPLIEQIQAEKSNPGRKKSLYRIKKQYEQYELTNNEETRGLQTLINEKHTTNNYELIESKESEKSLVRNSSYPNNEEIQATGLENPHCSLIRKIRKIRNNTHTVYLGENQKSPEKEDIKPTAEDLIL